MERAASHLKVELWHSAQGRTTAGPADELGELRGLGEPLRSLRRVESIGRSRIERRFLSYGTGTLSRCPLLATLLFRSTRLYYGSRVRPVTRFRGAKMYKCAAILVVSLGLSAWSAAQTPQPKPVSKKSTTPAKPASAPTKPVDPTPKTTYSEFTIGELVIEDANRWSDKMSSRISVSGFVTDIAKGDDGDTAVRICENPKIAGMDRARCVVAKCIPKMPCDLPTVGKPITVKGISRYDAGVGAHWWEVQPVESIDK